MHESPFRLETEIAQAAAAFGQLSVIGQHHPPFAGSYQLVGVEAEDAYIAKTSALPSTVQLTMHLGRIFNDRKPIPVGKRQQRIHINRQPIGMNRHYRFYSSVSFPLNLIFQKFSQLAYIHIPGLRIRIHKKGNAAISNHSGRTGDDAEGRQHHNAPLLQTKRCHSQLQRRRAVCHSNGILAPCPVDHLRFETLHKRPFRGYPPGVDAFGKVLLLVAIEKWLIYRYHFASSLNSFPPRQETTVAV
jgi:hypothetical protein